MLKISEKRRKEIIENYAAHVKDVSLATQHYNDYLLIQATYDAINPYNLINEKTRYDTLQKQKEQFERTYPENLSMTGIKNEINTVNKDLLDTKTKLEQNKKKLYVIQEEINVLNEQLKRKTISTAATQHMEDLSNIYDKRKIAAQKLETENASLAKIANKKIVLESTLNDLTTKITDLKAYEDTKVKLQALDAQVSAYAQSDTVQQKLSALENRITIALKRMGGQDNYDQMQSHFHNAFHRKSDRQKTKQRNETKQSNRNLYFAVGLGIPLTIGWTGLTVGFMTFSFSYLPNILAVYGLLLATFMVMSALGMAAASLIDSFGAASRTHQENADSYTDKTAKLDKDLKPYCIPSSLLQFTSDNVTVIPSSALTSDTAKQHHSPSKKNV